jgi:hypothetical protein
MGIAANLVNSTFFGNYTTWYGGAISNDQTMTVTNCTFSNNASSNGGAIDNSKDFLLQNSIISNSMLGGNCSGLSPITDGGGNLRWPSTDSTCVGTFGDPQLSLLAQNGGPTPTMAIQFGSAAIRLAMANCPAADQRGMPRSSSPGRCDAGAYEWQGYFSYFPNVFRSLIP